MDNYSEVEISQKFSDYFPRMPFTWKNKKICLLNEYKK